MGRFDIKRSVKLFISLGYFSWAESFRALMKLAGRLPPARFTILYYHAIPAKHREAFSKHLDMLARWAQVVPASYRGKLSTGVNYVSITFDDAFLSVAENALPELIRRSFHSTIFVPVGSLGSHPAWGMEDGGDDSREIVMSPGDAEHANRARPWLDPGAHSMTHPHLTEIGRERAQFEIEQSRLQLREITGRDVRIFAFPYGDHNPSVIAICRMAGYDHVYSIEPQMIDASGKEFLRGRNKGRAVRQ